MSSVGHKRGHLVVEFRRKHKLTQDELAEILGITKAGVVMWEENKRGVSEPIARLLAMFDKYPKLILEF